MSVPPPPPQWVIDLYSEPPARTKATGIPDPPGFLAAAASTQSGKKSKQAQVTTRKPPTEKEMDTLKLKKAWELAIAPAKSLPMSAIGMYMTGNSLQIFSIYMVFQLFKAPLTGISNINTTFAKLESDGIKGQMFYVKIIYVLANMLALALGIYKVNAMGLLPTTRSDWLAWESQRVPIHLARPE